MSDVTMSNLETLLKRTVIDKLDKAIAAALTAAYETRLASQNAAREAPADENTVKDEILATYFSFYSEVRTPVPRSRP